MLKLGSRATLARRDGAAVRAMAGMIQKRADSLGDFGAQDVLEGTGVGFELLVVGHVKGLGKEPLGLAASAGHSGPS